MMNTSRPHALCGRICQRRFSDSRFSDEPRIHRNVMVGHDHPCGEQMPHQLFLPDPANRQFIGMGQVQRNAFDLDCHGLFNCVAAEKVSGPG